MKRALLFIPVLFILAVSCKKSSSDDDGCVSTGGVPTAAEVSSVQDYLNSKGFMASQDPRGFFYQIVSSGFGTPPSLSDSVEVAYTGTLTSGTVFDATPSGQTRTFLLSDLIAGWKYGIPLIKKGGEINLYLPPSLGYGCSAAGIITPGSRLVFNIKLYDY